MFSKRQIEILKQHYLAQGIEPSLGLSESNLPSNIPDSANEDKTSDFTTSYSFISKPIIPDKTSDFTTSYSFISKPVVPDKTSEFSTTYQFINKIASNMASNDAGIAQMINLALSPDLIEEIDFNVLIESLDRMVDELDLDEDEI